MLLPVHLNFSSILKVNLMGISTAVIYFNIFFIAIIGVFMVIDLIVIRHRRVIINRVGYICWLIDYIGFLDCQIMQIIGKVLFKLHSNVV